MTMIRKRCALHGVTFRELACPTGALTCQAFQAKVLTPAPATRPGFVQGVRVAV